jgi:cell division protein FtsZ
MIHFDMPLQKSSIIKVLGFGGGGGNAVNHMFSQNIQNVDFIVCNTDAQALAQSHVPNKIQLGPHLTQGLGAGANPSIGRQATEESLDEIRRMLEVNTKMAFITAGMGGGTGTGGAPTVAKICKELGILTVGIVTTPFSFEGPRRMAQAQAGINELKENVDTLLVISNDKLRQQFGNLKMKETFAKADDVLSTAARCITDVINTTGQINVDFADVCTVMHQGGVAILGNAQMAGEDRAVKAIEAAINSPLLNDNDISGAKWILLNIVSSVGEHEYTMDEVETIQQYVRHQTGENTDVILGMGYDNTLGDALAITIIATGFQHKDPFAKPVVPKKVEAPIVMTLGVQGEEEKMFGNLFASAPNLATPVAAEKAPAVAQVPDAMPTSPVMLADAGIEAEETLNPILEAVNAAKAHEDGPVYVELSIELPQEPEAAALANPVFAPPYDTTRSEQNTGNGYLSKPAQIYAAPAANMPFMAPEPANEAPKTTPSDAEAWMPVLQNSETEEEESVAGLKLSLDENLLMPKAQGNLFEAADTNADLSEEEDQKKRAQERINRLRSISFNPLNLDNNSEFENVPAYMRRNLELHNSIANVEDFYSRAQVKQDNNNQTSISTLNNFLHGEKPD